MAYESLGADGGWGRMGRPTQSLLRRMRPVPSPEGLCSSSLGPSSPDFSSSVSKSPAVARLMRVLGEAHAGSFMKPCSDMLTFAEFSFAVRRGPMAGNPNLTLCVSHLAVGTVGACPTDESGVPPTDPPSSADPALGGEVQHAPHPNYPRSGAHCRPCPRCCSLMFLSTALLWAVSTCLVVT